MVDYDGFDDVSEISVLEFDPCLSDNHCPVALELKNRKHVPVEIYEKNQKKRRWNQLMQEGERKQKDLTALEKSVDTEVKTPNMLNEINSTSKELICDSALREGELREGKGKTTVTSNNGWFHRECQSKRSIFRKRLRCANKWDDKNETKTAFRG